MDSWNGKASNSHKLILNLPDKVNLKRSDGYIALYKNNEFKISAST